MKKNKQSTFIDKISLSFDKVMIGNIALTLLFLIFGIIIYLKPTVTLKVVGVVLGCAFILFGLFDIYEFVVRDNNPLFKFKVFLGALIIVLGVFTIIDPFKLAKLLTLALGIYLSLVALFKIEEALKLKKYGFDGWLLMLVVSIILLIFGIFIGINPMTYVNIIEATGIFIILASILEICDLLVLYTKAKNIMSLIKKNV